MSTTDWFAVIEWNQAGGLIPDLADTTVHLTQSEAEWTANHLTIDARARGRRERYEVVELIRVEDE